MSRSPHVNPLDMNKMFVPEGYVLLSDAIAEVGKALFPKDWDGLEFQCSQLVVEGELICTPDQISRRARVEHFFQDHAANKGLKIFYRDDVGGMHLTPPEWWNADNLTPRFTYCRINPDSPFSGEYSHMVIGSRQKYRFFLFADQAGLDEALKVATNGESQAKGSARSEAEARKKLIAYFNDGKHSSDEWVKNDFWIAYFKGEISGRSFDRAWQSATANYPERRSKGRRSGR